ncbi:MAG: hybrid non-ribosomal peptide synthase/polyketide synthase [Gemmatimonadetes bacterium]|nr:hybrid non-ribosomal peptide synthase/polyketide synthase [Gemmatimonadota bacterium]
MDTQNGTLPREGLSDAKRALLEKRLRGEGKPLAPRIAIKRVTSGSVHPMSYAQERLWFLDQMEPGSPFYNIPVASLVSAKVDIPTLQRALEEIVRRHESVRTVFRLIDGQPKQVVLPPHPMPIKVVDIRGPNGEDAGEDEIRRRTSEEGAIPFDLYHGPLFRATLLRVSEADYAQVLCMHHIVTDGWSMPIVTREMEQLYEAFVEGQPSPLGDLEIQYPDYSAWQREFLTGATLRKQVDHWKQHLSGAPVLEMPTDRPRPGVQRYNGGIYRFVYPGALVDGIRGLGRQLGASVNMVVMAGYNLMLHKYSGQDDIVVGTLVGNRNHAEVESMVGFLVNTAAIRTVFPHGVTFRELVLQARAAVLDADANQDLPFDFVVDALKVERDLSRNPVFQVMYFHHTFVKSHHHLEHSAMGSRLNVRSLFAENTVALVDTTKSKFDQTLATVEMEGGMPGMVEYNSDLWDRDTVARMIRHLRVLLERGLANPDAPVDELLSIADDEAVQIAGWNDTARDYPREASVTRLFEDQARRTPDAPAAVFGGVTLSYAELNARANRLANHLRGLGVAPGSRVGLCAGHSTQMVVALAAILKAGAAVVPLDPEYPAERLAYMMRDTALSAVVTEQALRAGLPPTDAPVVLLDADWAKVEQAPADDLPDAAGPLDAAYVIFTSGSTGTPKGVQLHHRAVVRTAYAPGYVDVRPGDRLSQMANTAFDAAIFEVWGALLNGAACVGVPRELALSPQDFAREVKALGITHAFLTTQLFNALAREVPHAFSGLRYAMFGGEAADAVAVRRVLAEGAPGALLNLYGPTESTVFATAYRVEHVPGDASTVPIGRAIGSTRAYVLDGRGQPVGVGIPGELYLGGDGVALGYLGQPELTSQRFLPDPFAAEPDARMYRTGDRVRWLAEGALEFLGRFDDQVKVRGFRIELGEIEAALDAHPGVKQSTVAARADGPGEKRLVAYVVPAGAEAPTAAELRAHLKERLPDYMVPAFVVTLDVLPLTPNGKVDRRALPAPEVAASVDAGGPAGEPRTETERRLTELWAEVLGVPHVGVHDNFFELGGDSILSIQIIARAGEAGLRITPKQMFMHQTIAELAPLVGTAAAVEAEQEPVEGEVPLTAVQHWFFEQQLPEPGHFSLAFAYETRDGLDPALLERAAAAVVRHHDALRMRYEQRDGAWVQTCDAPSADVPFTFVDLSAVSEDTLEAEFQARCTEAHRSLNLARGPAVRFVLFRLPAGRRGRLLVTAHHLVADAVSMALVTQDLERAYTQLAGGGEPALPRKTTSFRQWARRVAEHVRTGGVAAEAAYWTAEGSRAVSALPRDRSGGGNTEATAGRIVSALDEADTRALLYDVPPVYTTQINDVLLTALTLAFARWTGDGSLRIDLEGHGREDLFETVDLSRTAGWFTAVYPVTLALEEPGDLGRSLKGVKEQLRGVPHKGIGYGMLRYLAADAATAEALRTAPAAEVSFNYLGQLDAGHAVAAEDLPQPLLVPAEVETGVARSPLGPRPHLLGVDALVSGGRLYATWTYPTELYEESTAVRLAEGFMAAVRDLIAHCRDPQAGGFTPSDFSMAGLDQDALDALLSQLGD